MDAPVEPFTVEEAAAYLRSSPRFVWKLLQEGRVPKIKVGRLTRVSRVDLDEYLMERRVRSPRVR